MKPRKTLLMQCAGVIRQLCKINEDEYDKDEIKFRGSGNKDLDSLMAAYTSRIICPEFGGTLDVETIEHAEDSPLGDISDLRWLMSYKVSVSSPERSTTAEQCLIVDMVV